MHAENKKCIGDSFENRQQSYSAFRWTLHGNVIIKYQREESLHEMKSDLNVTCKLRGGCKWVNPRDRRESTASNSRRCPRCWNDPSASPPWRPPPSSVNNATRFKSSATHLCKHLFLLFFLLRVAGSVFLLSWDVPKLYLDDAFLLAHGHLVLFRPHLSPSPFSSPALSHRVLARIQWCRERTEAGKDSFDIPKAERTGSKLFNQQTLLSLL